MLPFISHGVTDLFTWVTVTVTMASPETRSSSSSSTHSYRSISSPTGATVVQSSVPDTATAVMT
jgi:hypothetical protein